jgi:2-amino-4-hydroxy-6-hydroxymethyldihydropteridine diphosphokinase|tara:strand:+ start:45 stop:422 length:378 start_codon:yes stop_codon:yes gene_type:complete
MKYYLSLGSNIDAQANIDLALLELDKIFSNSECSSIYQTQAEGFKGDDFLNLVFAGNIDMAFKDLNKKLKKIEDISGRKRNAPKFGPRSLDIDIILQLDHKEEILFESDEITKYEFVSQPLSEIV